MAPESELPLRLGYLFRRSDVVFPWPPERQCSGDSLPSVPDLFHYPYEQEHEE
jgi:hypothetical protein